MHYYLDESGNTGDISLTKPELDFGGQPVFALACVGLIDPFAVENYINILKKKHNILSTELKTTSLYNKKPNFIKDVLEYIEEKNIPFFIEIVDKKYLLAINIVNHYVMPHYFSTPRNEISIIVKNQFSDFIYQQFPDSIFNDFINLCKEPSNIKVLEYFRILIRYLNQNPCEISQRVLMHVKQNLDKCYYMIIKEGDDLYERFVPIPDINKKGDLVWMLPHYSSFTNIYARINLFHKGNLSNVTITHDEQAHFDEIIKNAKVATESIGEYVPSFVTPNANYNFTNSAPLFFADSKGNIGIQIADILSGFSMRFTSDYISKKEICLDKQKSFDILFNCGNGRIGVGMNFVISGNCAEKLFNTVELKSGPFI
jgi:hypothetical protein